MSKEQTPTPEQILKTVTPDDIDWRGDMYHKDTVLKLLTQQREQEKQKLESAYSAGVEGGIDASARIGGNTLEYAMAPIDFETWYKQQQEWPEGSKEWKQAQIRSDIDCPECGTHHIDKGEWAKRLHKRHECEKCNHTWKPYEHYTFGI